MHNYATNSPIRHKLMFGIAVIAVVLAGAIGFALTQLNQAWGLQIGGVSSMALFGILFLVFDRYLWRIRFLRAALMVPDLNGKWICDGRTISKDGENTNIAWSAQIIINQSWSRISIVLKTSQSSSRSIAASLYASPGAGYRLIYHYDNSPQIDQGELQRHSGQCDLMFDEVVSSAQGSYFTDRDRQTIGTMQLRKEV